MGESGHGTRGSPAIGLSRPQREAAGQGLGASRTAWGSLRPPREPHRGDKRAHPGLWGAAALGGARGQERLLRGACARSTAAKMETPQTSPNPPSDSKARKRRCLSLSLNFAQVARPPLGPSGGSGADPPGAVPAASRSRPGTCGPRGPDPPLPHGPRGPRQRGRSIPSPPLARSRGPAGAARRRRAAPGPAAGGHSPGVTRPGPAERRAPCAHLRRG